MPKLPTLQKDFTNRFEGNTSGYNAMAQGISSIAKGLMDMASLTKGIQDIEDKTNANKELVDFKLQATRKADELALKFENDPDAYLKEYNNFLTQSKDNLIYNTKVSVLNKGEYKTLLDSSLVELGEIGYKNSNNLKIKKATNDIKDIASNLNELSYKYGKDGDLEQFDTLQQEELSKLEESSLNIIPQSQRQAFFDKAKKDNYVNFLQGRIVVDPELAIQEIDSGVYNDKINEEELDKMRAMASKFLENNNKKNATNNSGYEINPIINNEAILQLDNRLQEFDIGSDGKVIKNENMNNFNDIVEFMNFVDTLYLNNSITAKQKATYYEKINKPFKIILENDFKTGDKYLNENYEFENQNYILRKIKDYTDGFDSEDRAMIFKNVYNELQRQGLYNNTNEDARADIKNIVEKQTLLFLNNQGYNMTEDDLKNPIDYISKTKYERSMNRIFNIVNNNDNIAPFGDLSNIVIKEPIKKTSEILVKDKK